MTATTEKSNMDIERRIAETVRKVRKAAGVSMESLGAAVGITYQQVQKYESCKDRISLSRLVEIATFLDIPLRDFFEPKLWGRDMSDEEAELLLVIRRMKDDDKKAALATVLRQTSLRPV